LWAKPEKQLINNALDVIEQTIDAIGCVAACRFVKKMSQYSASKGRHGSASPLASSIFSTY
jgi:hypothetical protein